MANVSVHVRKSKYLTMAHAKSAFMSLIFSRLECRFPAVAVHGAPTNSATKLKREKPYG
jgi:hypothetical protein